MSQTYGLVSQLLLHACSLGWFHDGVTIMRLNLAEDFLKLNSDLAALVRWDKN